MDLALAFQRSFARRQAHQVIDVPGGCCVLDPRYPASYHHNRLIISGRPTADEIIAAAEATLGGSGLGHRMLVIEDDVHGTACAQALAAAGYQHESNLVMRHPGGGTGRPADPAIRVGPVSVADLSQATHDEWRANLPDADESVLTQLVARRATLADGADQVQFLAVRDPDGRVLSHADLYLHPAAEGPGRVAQIEDLVTGAEHTGHGYAGAILAEALRLAEDAGCDLVFLVADGDGWPQHWYRRLGFAPIGRFHGFIRPGQT